MRIGYLLTGLAALLSVSAASDESSVPEIVVTASFPESNPFGHVVNGEKNKINILLENKSKQDVTLVNVAGSFHNPETDAVVKNTTTLAYKAPLTAGGKLSIPYAFYSEFKPSDLRLHLWVEHEVDNQKYRVSAYDSIITIVEPEMSIFDFKLISTYLMVTVIFGGLSYVAYLSLMPQTKKTHKRAPAPATALADDTAAATGTGYQEEWIPEHHLKKSKSGKGKGKGKGKDMAVSSADEVSASEVSDGKRRKGKK